MNKEMIELDIFEKVNAVKSALVELGGLYFVRALKEDQRPSPIRSEG